MRPVLISSASGSGRVEDEVLLASTRRLLSRGARRPIVALSSNLAISSAAHPDVDFLPSEELIEALESAQTLLIVGDLSSVERLREAARQVAQAKLAGVPVALVAVRLPQPGTPCELDLCAVLAQSESVSTSDADSARGYQECSGQRAHIAAPLELLMRADPERPRTAGGCVGIDETLLTGTDARFVQQLDASVAKANLRLVAVARPASPAKAAHAYMRRESADWRTWLQAIGACDVFVACAHSLALHVAAGQEVVPLGVADGDARSELLERLGLASLVIQRDASQAQVDDAFQSARAFDRGVLAARAATLRTVAWRALGPLADATCSRPLRVAALPDGARRLVARSFEVRVRQSLEAGALDAAADQLAAWRLELENEPRWALAQAQLEILHGRERDARVLLERATAVDPSDIECHATLAMVLWRLGDVDAARQQWERVAELEPASARAPYQIGCLEMLRGRMEQAILAWREAGTREPEHQPSQRALADAPVPRVRDGAA